MGTFLCPECGKNFSVDADLYLHQVRAHDTNSYTCENCGETVIGKKTLDNHMRKHNTAVTRLKRTHKCEECPYETKDKANLSKHIDLNVNVDVGSAATDPESVDQNISTSVVNLGFDVTSADIDPLLNMSLDDINQAIMTWI